MDAYDVIYFWFKETDPKKWFQGGIEFDLEVTRWFSEIHEKASRSELFSWRQTAEGRLAEIIILDQFSRNIFRNSPKAFAQDPLALILAQEMVAKKMDESLSIGMRAFAYMPYMHSESLIIHAEAKRLFSQPGLEENYKFELAHENILKRFGRYPHRNIILGRESTPEEIEFLKTPGSSF